MIIQLTLDLHEFIRIWDVFWTMAIVVQSIQCIGHGLIVTFMQTASITNVEMNAFIGKLFDISTTKTESTSMYTITRKKDHTSLQDVQVVVGLVHHPIGGGISVICPNK